MNAPVKDLYRRYPKPSAGKHRYQELRDAGMDRTKAAYGASISISYAATLDAQMDGQVPSCMPTEAIDDAYVDALVALGGLPRLSERLGRLGHTVCLPLVQFGGRP